MAKRSAQARRRNQRSAPEYQGQHDESRYGDNVRRLFDEPAWSPLGPQGANEERETKYRKNIRPQNEAQGALIEAIDRSPLVFAAGAAGTGKTYLAVAKGVEALESGRVRRIVACRRGRRESRLSPRRHGRKAIALSPPAL